LSYFQNFKTDIAGIALPDKFTFPFYYDPHPLILIATKEIQTYLTHQTDFKHNFGLGKYPIGIPIGKMFGVLIVQNQQMEIGYLAAFSGKLSDKSAPERFVPPIFDVHSKTSFYPKEEIKLNALNQQINDLERNPRFIELQKMVKAKNLAIAAAIKREKAKMKIAKQDRKIRREKAQSTLSPAEFAQFKDDLAKESIYRNFRLKDMTRALNASLAEYQNELDDFTHQIADLKKTRKNKSTYLQHKIFDSYQFLNQYKIKKGLTEIFPNFKEQKPPAGTGDCSTPKLLQYAFSNNLKPLAMGEFWWGISPVSEIRRHKVFYPACGGRCKPILGHMLEGMELEENPFLKNPAENKSLKIVYEDDALLIINKPAEFLSVPGKQITDSVYTRIKNLYPHATGPLVVHRLDMSTSGILVLSKTKEAHKFIQHQFIKRTVKKRYVALLEGIIEADEGYIELPLRVDLDDRPRQLVCYEYGKMAKTKWKVVERADGKTRIHFYPITGRTHQLRVHASHSLGLNTPIIGDDLYGQKANRLHLHAAFITFIHPLTKEKVSFTVEADF
jgi:tRNA pseudouridine32 synthase/23S rRNA pseudouridine746 synthase